MPSRRPLFVALYALSGAAALVYEISWTRLLTLQMGHTVAAASTVLAAFMGGLAFGSWIGGRLDGGLATTRQNAHAARLRTYAALEIGIAIAALALPFVLAAFVPVLAWAYHDALTPTLFGLVRVVLCLVILGVPATAMGATFPVAVGWYASVAADAGLLYAANTAGAAVGAVASGFWLIPAVGLRATTWVGIALNLMAAGGALWIASTTIDAETVKPAEQARARSQKDSRRSQRVRQVPSWQPMPRVAMAATAVAGFAALIYEVAWTRLLTLVIGPTTYAFTTVVASFIIGLATGSAAGARLVRRSSQPAMWLAAMLVLTAVGASTAGWFAGSRLPLIVASQVGDPNGAFGRIVTRQAFAVMILLLPMTCAFGAAFPLALAVASAQRRTAGRDAARVYTSNTLGAIAGAFVGGFVLLPLVGLHTSFRAAALIGLVAALGVWLTALGWRPPVRGRAALMLTGFVFAAGVVLLLPPWDLNLLAGGVYKYAPYIDAADLETELRA